MHATDTVVELELHTADPAQTRSLGARLGALLQGGEVIALMGDLGAGKTTLVQGILQGMGSSDRVTSPTYTLVNVYRAGNLEVHHVDAYRLAEMSPHGNRDADALSLGLDDLIGAPDVVVLIEWAEVVPSLLSSATLVVHMTAESEARTLLIAARDTRGIELLSAL